jgi:hypothetical protein
MLDGMFTIIAAAVMLTAGAVSLKLAAMMIFGDTVKLPAAMAISAFATLAAVASLLAVEVRLAEDSITVFVPGVVFAASSWMLGMLLAPYERTNGWPKHSKAFVITMAQCIGVTTFGAVVSSTFIVGTWALAAVI